MTQPVPQAPPPALPPVTGTRVGQVVLTVVGALLVLGCGLAVTVVLLLSTGPVGYLAGLALACVPAVPLVLVYLWLDRHEPEPRGLLLFGFGWGASVATAGALLLSLPPTLAVGAAGGDAEVVGAVLVAPVVEEALKGLGILVVVWLGRRALDGLVDGVVYAGMVGVGFAFTENILYLGVALAEGGVGGLLSTFVVRGVVSPFAHPLFTAAFGIGLVLYSRRRGSGRALYPLVGLAAAIGLHALWNGLAVVAPGGFLVTFVVLWVPLFTTFVVVALLARRREARMIRTNLALYSRYGYLAPAEERMVGSLAERRQALEWARARGGSPARAAMHRFQVAAVRLAHLRQRMEDGTAPWDAAQRERDLLALLASARAAYAG
ncbi:PrsW family intramembrane metalloprotease [Aquipuribacter sp. SD81]|uniref:PrsW family intramembrane metalloprotease n=1 Tax=Aquipuribacter sp. SD81 TaxID=3127703 RepID=UPI0030180EC4